MWGWIGPAIAGLLGVGLLAWLALVVSMRTKYQPVLTVIKRMNRSFTNPRALRAAGQAGATYAVIHHVGRATGTAYRTPIGVAGTDAGFVTSLPYGTGVDWLKNVLVTGSAVIEVDGRTYHVTAPRVVGAAEADGQLSRRERLTHRLYGVDQVLVLTRTGADVAAGEHR